MDKHERARALARVARELRDSIPLVEVERYARCETCGQFYDTHDFAEVVYHDDAPHEPMKPDA